MVSGTEKLMNEKINIKQSNKFESVYLLRNIIIAEVLGITNNTTKNNSEGESLHIDAKNLDKIEALYNDSSVGMFKNLLLKLNLQWKPMPLTGA